MIKINLKDRMEMWLVGLMLLIVNWSSSAPIANEEIGCQYSRSWLPVHQQVTYLYTASIGHHLSQTESQTSTHLQCTVIITSQSHCHYHLKLELCSMKQMSSSRLIKDSTNDEQLSAIVQLLHRNPVLFDIGENGMTNMKGHTEDSVVSVNIKRGVLGLLQPVTQGGTISNVHSVHGECVTSYTQIDANHVKLTSDLNSCSEGSLPKLAPFININQNDIDIQSVMPISGSRQCTIDHSEMLTDISCEESYVDTLGPQHVNHQTKVSQHLTVINIQPAEVIHLHPHMYTDIDLTYLFGADHHKPDRVNQPPQTMLEELTTAFHDLINKLNSWSSPVTLRSMSSLQKVLKKSNIDVLQLFVTHVMSCPENLCNYKNKDTVILMLTNSLVSCGTEQCVQRAVELVSSQSLTTAVLTDLWFTLTTTHSITQDMASTLVAYCVESPSESCIIPLSVILKQYDHQSPVQEKYLDLLMSLLDITCKARVPGMTASHITQHLRLAVAALKALKNLGESIERRRFTSKLNDCLKYNGGNPQILVPTIQIFKNTVYESPEAISVITGLLNDINNPIDVRVTAFHTVMKSNNVSLLEEILGLYNGDPGKQMKAYLMSYFRNLLEQPANSSISSSVESKLMELLQNGTMSVPVEYTHQQTSWQGILVDKVNDKHKSEIISDSLFNPGSLTPNKIDLNLNIEAFGMTLNLADLGIKNEGFDFTSDIYGNNHESRKYKFNNNLSHVITRSLQRLHQQITSTFIYPYLNLDLNLFGNELGQIKIQDFYLWRIFSHAEDFDRIWNLLNMDHAVRMLNNGIEYDLSKLLVVPLFEVSMATGMGLPVKYSVDGTLLARGHLDMVLKSGTDITNFGELVGKSLKGHVKLRTAFELRHQMSVALSQVYQTQSSVCESWFTELDQPFSVSSTDNRLQIQLPASKWPLFSSHHKLNGQITHSNRETSDVTLDQSDHCLLSFLQSFTGWHLCSPQEHTGLPLLSSMGNIIRDLSYSIWNKVPVDLKSSIVSFFEDSVSMFGSTIVMNIKFPTSVNDSLQPRHWLQLLNDVWVKIRESTISVPESYTATVTDSGYMYTFDGTLYKFPGYSTPDCTYILAHDYSQYRFTVFQNSQMVTVSLQQITVALYRDGRVVVNNTGIFSDLPVSSWDNQVVISRDGPVVHLTTTYGVEVLCNQEAGYCTYKLSGWYHNRTQGLLGTNDNEPFNDFKLRDGTITSDIQKFLNSYEVTGGRVCHQPPNTGRVGLNKCIHDGSLKCKELFEAASSPLAPCFPVIDPTQFMTACENDVSNCYTGRNNNPVCPTVRTYMNLCLQKNIQLSPVSECIACETSDKNTPLMSIGQTWDQPLNNKLDVVFVVSLHQEMNKDGRPLTDYFQQLMVNFKKVMRQGGIPDVRVGLVGYDGVGAMQKPHAYVVNGQLFTSLHHMSDIRSKVSALSVEGTTHYNNNTDVLKQPLKYPYRTDAIKMVLWVTHTQNIQTDITDSLVMLYQGSNIHLNVFTIADTPQLNIQSVQSHPFLENNVYSLPVTSQHHRQHTTRTFVNIKNKIKTVYSRQCQQCTCYMDKYASTRTLCHNVQCGHHQR